jgi:hypothetical protein
MESLSETVRRVSQTHLAKRIRFSAEAVRCVATTPDLDQLAHTTGAILDGEIQCGVFPGPEWAMLRGLVQRAKAVHSAADWQAAAFDAAVECLVPEWKGDRVKGCFALADAMDRQAAGIEAELAKIDKQAPEPGDGEAAATTPAATARGVAPRDDWFLQQWKARGTDTYRSPKRIRDKWNKLPEESRAAICLESTGRVTLDTVTQGRKRAQARRDNKVKPARKRRRAALKA